ncbi:MAG TPA: glutamine amidotransferase [Armatimonadota bacterium]
MLTLRMPTLALVLALGVTLGLSAVDRGPAGSAWAADPVAASPLPVIENDLYRLTFDPARGGRCSSFFLKANQREWVYDGDNGGLFEDHFAHQYWPGELMSAKYEYALEPGADGSQTIRLWTVPSGTDPLTRGLRVEKKIVLRPGHREVEVTNSFTNPTAEGKNVAMWIQQCFAFGGQRLYDEYYRPGVAGISLDGMDDTGMVKFPKTVDDYAQDWVKQPVAGWSAGRDRKSNEGAVFLMDYNYLDILYNCAGSYTTEWFMDKVPVPPNKAWTTQYWVVPVNGFRGFTYADRKLIANLDVKSEGGGLALKHQLCGTAAPLGAVTIRTRVYGVRSKQEAALPEVALKDVGLAPVDAPLTWPKPQTEPLVFRVEIAGAGWSEKYEYLYEGSFASAGIQGAPSAPEYPLAQPQKVKTFLKPDTWTRPHNAHLRVLLMYGIWTQHYRVERAIRDLDPEAEIVKADGWGFFPATYDTLLGYDLLVLSDMPAGPDYANEMVADFARHGGGVLTLGGMLTYGAGQWRGTALEGLLPVKLVSNYDLARANPDLGITPAAPQNWPASARFFWMNVAEPKPDTVVWLRAGGYPLLVIGNCGEGRVATVLGTCHGEPARGEIAAWRTPAWNRMLVKTLQWLREGGK